MFNKFGTKISRELLKLSRQLDNSSSQEEIAFVFRTLKNSEKDFKEVLKTAEDKLLKELDEGESKVYDNQKVALKKVKKGKSFKIQMTEM